MPNLERDEARMLVDTYYLLQRHRIRMGNQISGAAISDGSLIHTYYGQVHDLEKSMPRELGKWAKATPEGEWALGIKGIGPVLAAGLVAHIDIEDAPTAGHIWRFAGLDPTVKWEKGQKRPFNASLKVICWKIGDSFVKVSGRDGASYGQWYRVRKAYEIERNERGGNAEAAAETLATRNIKDKPTRTVYESGKLPAGRIDLRARRWAVKLFLSHYQEVAFEAHFHTAPPAPYAVSILNHGHRIAPDQGPDSATLRRALAAGGVALDDIEDDDTWSDTPDE